MIPLLLFLGLLFASIPFCRAEQEIYNYPPTRMSLPDQPKVVMKPEAEVNFDDLSELLVQNPADSSPQATVKLETTDELRASSTIGTVSPSVETETEIEPTVRVQDPAETADSHPVKTEILRAVVVRTTYESGAHSDRLIVGNPISNQKPTLTLGDVVEEFADSFRNSLESKDPSELVEKFKLFGSTASCLNDFFATTGFFRNFHVASAEISEDDREFSLELRGELDSSFGGTLKDTLRFEAAGSETLKVMMFC